MRARDVPGGDHGTVWDTDVSGHVPPLAHVSDADDVSDAALDPGVAGVTALPDPDPGHDHQ